MEPKELDQDGDLDLFSGLCGNAGSGRDDGEWLFQRPCEVGIFPLTVALNMIAKRIVEEAVKQEETGGKLENGKTYAWTGKLLRVYDQAQEYLLDSLKNKRF